VSLHVEVNVQNANPSANPNAIVARVIVWGLVSFNIINFRATDIGAGWLCWNSRSRSWR
jgi:uncharacterized membrane protein